MLIIGLTGGIGSGKSTIADIFAQWGVPIIDADAIAHELTQPNQPAVFDIVDHFPQEILLENGGLNRKRLRQIIFAHPAERKWLENLLHPLIEAEIKKRIAELTAPYCLVVVPLLFETKPYAFINRILVVDAERQTQINRVTARDLVSPTHVEDILAIQTSREARLTGAHDVINNEGSKQELAKKVEELHKMYLNLSIQLKKNNKN